MSLFIIKLLTHVKVLLSSFFSSEPGMFASPHPHLLSSADDILSCQLLVLDFLSKKSLFSLMLA